MFANHYDIQVGYLNGDKLAFADIEMEDILYSNTTKLIKTYRNTFVDERWGVPE